MSSAQQGFDVDKMLLVLKKAGDLNKAAGLIETHIRMLIGAVRDVLLKYDQTLLTVPTPVHIFGDIHGQFADLIRHFDNVGWPDDPECAEQNYLFLGDYVDRGQLSLETITMLFIFKIKFPTRFFLLRGNHECGSINRIYGFYDECKRRFNIKLWKLFTEAFNCLPVAAIVADTIFCVHGGLSPNFQNLQQILDMARPFEVPDQGLFADLLWSDPDEDITGWGENDRGVSWTFGGDIVLQFLEDIKCTLICRAHQVVEDGYQFFQKRKLVTLFSAPNYCGEFDNAGAILSVSSQLLCTFTVIKPMSLAETLINVKKK